MLHPRLSFILLGRSFAPDLYRLIFVHVVASSFLITLISSKMLVCGFHTAFFKQECQPSTCVSAVEVEIVPLLELELPTQ